MPASLEDLDYLLKSGVLAHSHRNASAMSCLGNNSSNISQIMDGSQISPFVSF
jgi:hypothetical protein